MGSVMELTSSGRSVGTALALSQVASWDVAGPETLSRALKELEQRGAITLKPRLKVVNPDALRQAIGSH